nr:hypothetical protein [Tanacetum cinerariifolium]
MMVQAHADMDDTVETHQTPIVNQPSTSKPQKTQKPRRKQSKEAEVSYDELEDEDHVFTPSSDLLPSGEDSSILNELMVFFTSLQEQGRMIKEIDQNAEITLDDETQEKTNDDEMFKGDDLARKEVVMNTTTTVKDSVAPTKDVVVQEQEMSTTILVAATTVTTDVPTPRAKGIVFHEQKQSQIPTISSSKDKGKAKMIKPEVPIKKKDQMRIDKEYDRKLEAEEQEEARLSRAQQDEEANNTWDNMQAIMDADRLLAERLQAREMEEFSELQKARLEMRKVNDFIAMDSEAQESSTKRIAKHLESEISKKQKVDENVKPVIDDSKELKKCMEIVPADGDEVLIEATPLSSRSPTIINYKIHKE